MRLTLLSRSSDLAKLQALLVGRALTARWPQDEIVYRTRTSAGDRDGVTPLAAMPDKGAFTADLSDALASGDADMVVHSWKDLPLELKPGHVVAATLERADSRDVLVVRGDVVDAGPPGLRILSSSPRRSWLLQQSLPALLPWRVERLDFVPVRGNIPTRLQKLVDRVDEADALVVAKAALDRLLGFGPPFEEAAARIRGLLDSCRWMVLPIREVPGAPAQGAVAVEAMATNAAVLERLRAISHAPTRLAVLRERDVLADYGGGCHEALGATVLARDYGQVTSVRGRSTKAGRAPRQDEMWALVRAAGGSVQVPHAPEDRIWPRPNERKRGERQPLDVAQPQDDRGYWVARAEALPSNWSLGPDRLVYVAGTRTWQRLAERGIWVHGCADGLGDAESPGLDTLAGRTIQWLRLTHRAAADADPSALATYVVRDPLPDDLASRTHFFWASGTLFREALARFPGIARGWHGVGPGRTSRVVREALGETGREQVWLDYDDWLREIRRP